MGTSASRFVDRLAPSLAALTLMMHAASAYPQKADRPAIKVGDQWQFVVYYGTPSAKPNRVWVVTSVTPSGIEGTENGEPLSLTHDLNIVESPLLKASGLKHLEFPLMVGKNWSFTSNAVFKDNKSTAH